MSRIGGVIVIILLLLAAWWLVIVPRLQRVPSEQTAAEATSTPQGQWQWTFEDAGTDTSGSPQTRVTFNNGETAYLLGNFQGSCSDMQTSSWKLHEDEGEFAGAVCWYAGGGQEIGVFSDDGVASVRVGDLGEGDAENPPFRGNFKELLRIDFGFIRSLDTSKNQIAFDDARWLTGAQGEDAAIKSGICTEDTRSECLPNDFFIQDNVKKAVNLPIATNAIAYMVTWHADTQGIKRETISLPQFAQLIDDSTQHWNQLPYNVTFNDKGEVIMIEEVYVP